MKLPYAFKKTHANIYRARMAYLVIMNFAETRFRPNDGALASNAIK